MAGILAAAVIAVIATRMSVGFERLDLQLQIMHVINNPLLRLSA
jgi:hypothetical protein